jgi:16S rRNA (cytosine967-C5)-methyltransferase
MTNPRLLAVELLDKVLSRRLNFDDAFDREPKIAGLEQRDKNYLRNLCLTTFRHLGEIDHFLNKFTRAKSNILRLGVTQMKFLNTPPFAAVNEMVDVAETKEHKSFINAILRKVPDYEMDNRAALNIPKWMLGSWQKAYGKEEVEKFLPFLIKEPALDITIKQGYEWPGEHTKLPNGTVRLNEGSVTELPGFAEGKWWVQDAASSFAAKMFGDVKGKKVLDMCAAPGGKTAQLCDAGAIVTAVDDSQRRLQRLEENMERLGFAPEIICDDARYVKGEFDAVLIDAPCTATGTASKNPDVIHTREQKDVQEMAAIQKSLIESAHGKLKKGGELVYATCSLQYEEGEGQAKKLDAAKWKLLEEKRILPSLYAEFGGTGGFYCAKLQKL